MTLKRNTVFEDVKIEKNGISIEELPFIEKINLRGDTKDRDFMSNAGSVLDILIPTEPNTKIQNKDLHVIWLSPNEWLLSFLNDDHFIKILEDCHNKIKLSAFPVFQEPTSHRHQEKRIIHLRLSQWPYF